MLGPGMLVAPVLAQGASSVAVPLPRGARWFCAHSGQEWRGLRQAVPVRVKV